MAQEVFTPRRGVLGEGEPTQNARCEEAREVSPQAFAQALPEPAAVIRRNRSRPEKAQVEGARLLRSRDLYRRRIAQDTEGISIEVLYGLHRLMRPVWRYSLVCQPRSFYQILWKFPSSAR